MNPLTINPSSYQATQPFPYVYQDNFLTSAFAQEIQQELLDLSGSAWDRYNNPFEQKYTLRDKYTFPPNLAKLFDMFQSPAFVNQLSEIVGHELMLDTTRNFWGVHTYENGDYLDIHVDAGFHPTLGLKKQVTLGLYLSKNWDPAYGCELEIWNGTNAGLNNPSINTVVDKIAPVYNRLVLFTCNDYAWHGNPSPVKGSDSSKRIFITISYLSRNTSDTNKRVKALFVARPGDPPSEEKDRLRLLRADPERYKEIYRVE